MDWKAAGKISKDSLDGGVDLGHTLESGQTYSWIREDGRMFEDSRSESNWYYAAFKSDDTVKVLRVKESEDFLHWRSNFDSGEEHLSERLRLQDSLSEIKDHSPEDEIIHKAFDRYEGMRLVDDRIFPCLISFICSAQMRVGRIHQMQKNIRSRFGDQAQISGRVYEAFPTPEQLASATEQELRDCGLGYRAEYVSKTANMVSDREISLSEVRDKEYLEARSYLKQCMGVGNKVADCVLLFSSGFLQAVPLDTWIKTTINDYFPECDKGSYSETSSAIRARFGGDFAGYVQTYIFYYLRQNN